MILVAGGTGHLGLELVSSLTARGLTVRILTRDPDHARKRLGAVPELAAGDVRDPASLQRALYGVDAVVSAITGFGPGGGGPRPVDYEGNLNLIRAAEAAGASRFVMLSIHGASPDHPMHLHRMKHLAEGALQDSGLDWTIVRPTVFMELWTSIVGDPILKSGKTTIFGRGDNPVNFVSVRDVASVVALALTEPATSRQTIDVGGPDNVTFRELVGLFESVSGRMASVKHVPLPVMRLARLLLGPFRPDLAGIIEAGIACDTTDMSFEPTEHRQWFPQVDLTTVEQAVRRRLADTRRLVQRELRASSRADVSEVGCNEV